MTEGATRGSRASVCTEIDVLAEAGILLMHEAEHQCRRGTDAAEGITERGMQHGRRIAFAAGDRWQA